MTMKGGERLFQILGELPEELIQEAETDELENKTQITKKDAPSDKPRHRTILHWLPGALKYLPVAACLAMVCGGVAFFLGNMRMGSSAPPFTVGLEDAGDASGSAAVTEEAEEAAEAAEEDADDVMKDAGGSLPDAGMQIKPVCYDSYSGPILPMTVTGDSQKLKTARKLEVFAADDETGNADETVPLLTVEDNYRIRNASSQERTIQLVYPFAANLNRSYELEGEILELENQPAELRYAVGEGISHYMQRDISTESSLEDYEQIFSDLEGTYQEQALDKTEEWDRLVSVYVIANNQENMPVQGNLVAGLSVGGPKMQVLTYGFDYQESMEDGTVHYSFFAGEGEAERLLIIEGEPEKEPELSYYTNLDWEEQADDAGYRMEKQVMTYSDALRWCSRNMYEQLKQEYEQQVYEGELPEYLDEDIAYEVLMDVGTEETFAQNLVRDYHTSDIRTAFEQILGETRIVYAMTTVTIPAKSSILVKAHTIKRQNALYYTLLPDEDAGAEKQQTVYGYDIFARLGSRLNLEAVSLQVRLANDWELSKTGLHLKQKGESWQGRLNEDISRLTISLQK